MASELTSSQITVTNYGGQVKRRWIIMPVCTEYCTDMEYSDEKIVWSITSMGFVYGLQACSMRVHTCMMHVPWGRGICSRGDQDFFLDTQETFHHRLKPTRNLSDVLLDEPGMSEKSKSQQKTPYFLLGETRCGQPQLHPGTKNRIFRTTASPN